MEAMTKHRSHSAAFKRQVAQEFIAGETLHGLSQRHDISRQLIRIWVGKFEAGALDQDVQAADLIQAYEARIAALERLAGRRLDRAAGHYPLAQGWSLSCRPTVGVPVQVPRAGCQPTGRGCRGRQATRPARPSFNVA